MIFVEDVGVSKPSMSLLRSNIGMVISMIITIEARESGISSLESRMKTTVRVRLGLGTLTGIYEAGEKE